MLHQGDVASGHPHFGHVRRGVLYSDTNVCYNIFVLRFTNIVHACMHNRSMHGILSERTHSNLPDLI